MKRINNPILVTFFNWALFTSFAFFLLFIFRDSFIIIKYHCVYHYPHKICSSEPLITFFDLNPLLSSFFLLSYTLSNIALVYLIISYFYNKNLIVTENDTIIKGTFNYIILAIITNYISYLMIASFIQIFYRNMEILYVKHFYLFYILGITYILGIIAAFYLSYYGIKYIRLYIKEKKY